MYGSLFPPQDKNMASTKLKYLKYFYQVSTMKQKVKKVIYFLIVVTVS